MPEINSFYQEGGEKYMKIDTRLEKKPLEETLMNNFSSLFREYERRKKSERIKRGLLRRKTQLTNK